MRHAGKMTMRRYAIAALAGLLCVFTSPVTAQQGQGQSVTLRAARVLDGRGGTLTHAVVEIRGTKIVAVDQRTGPVTRDLGDATLLPGLIDVHVHLNWVFGPGGRFGERDVTAAYQADGISRTSRGSSGSGATPKRGSPSW